MASIDMTYLDIVSFIFTGIALIGGYELSKTKPKVKKANILFTINNFFSSLYFSISLQYAYLFLNFGFLVCSLIGVFRNAQNGNGIKKST